MPNLFGHFAFFKDHAMTLQFPRNFMFGTSTAAAQIETAVDHDWQGVVARDGRTFQRTTDHELLRREDADIIASLAPHYRMSLMWSRLQRGPYAPLDEPTALEYEVFMTDLLTRGVQIMLVLHHFTNPTWFSARGGWEKSENIGVWIDFVDKVVHRFGNYVHTWNTFNEPNVYASNGWILGEFPPFKKNLFKALTAIRNMGKAHEHAYASIKHKYPDSMVGISHNATLLEAHNLLGVIPAHITDFWHMDFIPGHFPSFDFFGMSYYARVAHDPWPVTYMDSPEKIKKYGLLHDDMWEYYPEGLRTCVQRYWKQYRKPLIITENGVCSSDDAVRVRAIREYLSILHSLIEEGVDIRGYYHWSTWDNFEWHLGPTFQFGLYSVDEVTMKRSPKPSAHLYSRLAHTGQLALSTDQKEVLA